MNWYPLIKLGFIASLVLRVTLGFSEHTRKYCNTKLEIKRECRKERIRLGRKKKDFGIKQSSHWGEITWNLKIIKGIIFRKCEYSLWWQC